METKTYKQATLTHDEALTALAALMKLDPNNTVMTVIPYKGDHGEDRYAIRLVEEVVE